MIVGLPGAGISAIFYLACVVLMPLHALWSLATGREVRSGQWRLVARQAAIAAGIVASVAAMAWMLDVVSAPDVAPPTGASGTLAAGEPVDRVLSRVGIYLTVGTLVLLIVTVQVLSLFVRRVSRRARRSPARSARCSARRWRAPRPSRRP